MIKVDNLEFTYPGASVFHGLNLTVAKGGKVTLTGPSGSGKTTLLKLLAGLLTPTDGQITLNGQQLTGGDTQRADLRNQNVGLIFQDYQLLPRLTVLENLQLRRTIAGLPATDDTPMLERVGLADFRHIPAHQLSGGQQQRLAAVRALMTRPSIILADEPTGNLDDTAAAMVLDLLESAEEATCLIATHDPRVLSHFKHTLALETLGAPS